MIFHPISIGIERVVNDAMVRVLPRFRRILSTKEPRHYVQSTSHSGGFNNKCTSHSGDTPIWCRSRSRFRQLHRSTKYTSNLENLGLNSTNLAATDKASVNVQT